MNQVLNHAFWNTHALLIARVLMGILFLVAGIQKLQGVDATAAYIGSMGVPAPLLMAWLSGIVEIAAAAALIVGRYVKEAALTLVAYILLVSFIFHSPSMWAPDNMQQVLFLKNMALVGGLLYMAAFGVGNTWYLGKK